MSEIQDLIRAMALDGAYRAAQGLTCTGCGLPATRYFQRGTSGPEVWYACPSCGPPPPDPISPSMIRVKTLADLAQIDIERTSKDERDSLEVHVESTEQRFWLTERHGTDLDDLYRFKASDVRFCWRRYDSWRWNPEASDLPNRKAVERLLRIAKAEP